jgi:hypothetical protein
MEYTLHKTWDGLIITSDEIVEKGDKSLLITEELTLVLTHFEDCEDDYAGKKVIAQQNQIDFSALSEEKQKRIGWFDVEKLADDFYKKYDPFYNYDYYIEKEAWKLGFRKAQELLSDKVFTLEDMVSCFNAAREYRMKNVFTYDEARDYIQSLSQKSWKVELEMKEEVLYTEDGLDYKGGLIPKLTKGKVKIIKILGNNE